jgi:hypothetical protein
VTRRVASLLGSLLLLLAACGKYGAPVRASEVEPPEAKPSLEIPLPAVTDDTAPDTRPAPEEEPPPEGAP